MKILVINAGSSSLKYQLFDMENETVLAKGLCERIGLDGRVKQSVPGRPDFEAERAMADHSDAIQAVTLLLTSPETGVIKSMDEISAVGHRVVHGGEMFNSSVLIDDSVIAAIEECVPLAPLHNPPNLVGIDACRQRLGDVPQVAVFDTAFHQTMPEKAFMYALPYEYYENFKIRRYGFHGTSHLYVSRKAAELLGRPIEKLKIITCHMGNGTSIAAVKNGKSVDTSMGFTPLEGVPMGTRSGSIDPAIIEFLSARCGMDIGEITTVMNRKSGVLGISGVSSDFRDLHAAADGGNRRAQLALDMFAYAIIKTIGGYAAAMGGCDALVFTAGIGENNARMRQWVAGDLGYMGLNLDSARNAVRGETFISTADSPGKIMVIPTDEELVIARDCAAIVGGNTR
ncbi:MAG: acetate kinase [Oscillospiraceae bacterium]|jgi:acetate kinase|nr:acetate kinase [Oscillospiraceae bacterium]